MIFLAAVLGFPSCTPAGSSDAQEDEFDYSPIVAAVNVSAVREHVEFLSSLDTRATGYQNNTVAAEYIFQKFGEYGLENVSYQEFSVVDCISYGANVTVLPSGPFNITITIHPLVPNFVCPSTTPPEGITGQLIYAGAGGPGEFDGLPMEGSIVLMDWESGSSWLTAAKLGAKAVIFLHPTRIVGSDYGAYRGDTPAALDSVSVTKYLWQTPFNFPRFYVEENGTATLLQHQGEQVRLVSTQIWTEVTGRNVIGFISGSEKPEGIVILSSYYDSYSVAPSIAPGAQEATGVSALLELAKYLVANKPPMTVMVVAYGGHHQALSGAFEFANEYYFPAPDLERRQIGERTWRQFNIDLSTGSCSVYLSFQGATLQSYNIDKSVLRAGGLDYLDRASLQPRLYEIVRELNEQNPANRTGVITPSTIEAGYLEGVPYDYFGRTGYRWNEDTAGMTIIPNLMPTKEFPYDHEPCLYIGPSGWTFTTPYDPRPYFWTPFDTVDEVNYENLEVQLELIYSLIVRTFEESLTKYNPDFDYSKRSSPFYPFGYWNKKPHWGTATGKVATWNESRAWYDPLTKEELGELPNPLIFFQGARPLDRRFTFAEDDGSFRIAGGILGIYYKVSHTMSAWVIDPETGNVVFAPDQGMRQWFKVQDLRMPRKSPYPECMYNDIGFFTVFNASTIAILDFISPLNLGLPQAEETGSYLSPLVSVYDSGSHLPPLSYGTWIEGQTAVCVVAARPGTAIDLTVAAAGRRYPTIVLVNASLEQPLGTGFTLKPREQVTIRFPVLQYAQDFYYLDKQRFDTLSRFIDVKESSGYLSHLLSAEAMGQALEEFQEVRPRYSWAQYQSINAWIKGREAYLYARSSMEDATSVVPFFALFLVPFAFLAEKLAFDLPGLRKILSLVGIFAAVFVSLYLLHPGFQLAASPVSIVIGFSVLVLAFPIVLIIFGEASAFMQELRVKAVGIHKAELSRSAQAIYAFTTGVENMKKRRLRTVLTLASLVIMISGLVGFTSISTMRVAVEMRAPAGNKELYTGVYIHMNEWGHGQYDLRDSVLGFLQTRYGDNATIAPRAWAYTLWPNTYAYSPLDISFVVNFSGNRIYPKALLGLTPQEDQVTGIGRYISQGRWFEPGERFACILGETQADLLGVEVGGVITVEGLRFPVIGIVEETELETLPELDGEEITPIKRDFPPGDINPWDIHLPLSESLILCYEDVRLLGGGIASVSMNFTDLTLVKKAADEFCEALPGFMAFSWDGVGVGGDVVMHGGRYKTTVWGLQTQIIPMAIVVLSIFNLLLGSVYERKRDIGIYGTLGLSPLHVFVLFLAETVVYGLIGGIVGYLTGISLFKIYDLVAPGAMAIDYSSGLVMIAVGGGMLATVLSSLYPAYVSSKLVTPSLERAWRVPTAPVGDIWELTLPFLASSREEAKGILSYLDEFMRQHEIPDAPVFSIKNMRHVQGLRAEAPFMGLSMECRLVPHQLGILQKLDVLAAMVEPTRWEIRVVVRRTMGAISEWTRLNKGLFTLLREQLLLWRTLPDEEKDRYARMPTFPAGDESA